MKTPTERRRDERGQASLLIVGFAVVLLMTVAAVVDASAAYLQRQGLDTLADGAALQGADTGAEGDEVYTGGIDDRPLHLTAAAARSGVRRYLADVGAFADYPGLQVDVRIADTRVVVHLTAPVDLPLSVPGSPDQARVGATGAATVSAQS